MIVLVIATGVVGYAAMAGAMWAMQRRLMYRPDITAPSPRCAGVSEMDEVTLTGSDGLSLLSWYRPALCAGVPTLIYFQGNAGNLNERGHKVRPYLDRGMGVLLVGYRGFGGNPGRPSEGGLYEDGRTALDFLERRGVSPSQWVIYGESLGTGIAVQMACERAAKKLPVGCVVLESPFTSMVDAARYRYPFLPVRALVRDRYDSLSKIAALGAPLLVVHGTSDPTVPLKQGQALFAAAGAPKEAVWIEGGDHSDLYDFGAQDVIVRFLEKYFTLMASEA